ncbi:MAG: hypothetical protein HY619_05715 [Thaumarchaeota archaeon]|nr:hypothetical protein [Nitrososphaerota archaeon]
MSEGFNVLRVGGDLPDRLRILFPEQEALTLEKVKEELVKFGLTLHEARVYIHLARLGPRKANKVSEELGIHRTETYRTLALLQNKGIVTATLERPIRFIALPFEEAVKKLIKLEKEKILLTNKKSQYVFDLWHSLPERIEKEVSVKQFQILEGVEQVFAKADEMLGKVGSETLIMAAEKNVILLDQEGLLDRLKDVVKERRISVSLLVGLESEKKWDLDVFDSESVRLLSAIISPVPSFILTDNNELMFFTGKGEVTRKKIAAIWTNYEVLVRALHMTFMKLWKDSSAIQKQD